MSTKDHANALADAPASTSEAAQDPVANNRRILVADDNEDMRISLKKVLEVSLPVSVDTTADGREALEAITQRSYSILITDLRMPHINGMQLIQEVQERRLPVTVIVLTAHGSIDEAVRAMQLGAYDFLTKPPNTKHLCLIVLRALRQRELQDEVAALREQLGDRYAFRNILSRSPSMHAVFELIGHVAQTATTVLIEGETGTGKEQVARAIHDSSSRRTGPMVAINCAAVPESLLESELFGHEKGAFTNAVGQRKGRFELANGGTLFLDEVGDLPPAMQAKLLRVLQERRFERVGGSATIEVDVRIIAATNRSLHKLVKEEKFREDLYYRLNVVRIELPPLHARTEDIPLLATYFAQKYARSGSKQISPEAMEVLLRYRWPGNIRELENAMERACVTAQGTYILPENLPPDIFKPPEKAAQPPIDLSRPLTEQLAVVVAAFEERYLRQAMQAARGHIGDTAKISGLSRRSISDKIALYRIDKSQFN